jgi:hypothetical protein
MYRGVAQLIARSVWDREVEGLSPFTPTKENESSNGWLFFFAGAQDTVLRLGCVADNSRRFAHDEPARNGPQAVLRNDNHAAG